LERSRSLLTRIEVPARWVRRDEIHLSPTSAIVGWSRPKRVGHRSVRSTRRSGPSSSQLLLELPLQRLFSKSRREVRFRFRLGMVVGGKFYLFPHTVPTVLAEKVRVRILGFVSLLVFRPLIECLKSALKWGIYSLPWAWVSVT